MSSFRGFDRQFRRVLSTIGIAAVLIVPSFMPVLAASADTVATRSIALSSASINATNVTYNVTFTPTASTANAFAIDFCTSAAIGDTCTAPGNSFTAANAATTTSGYSIASKSESRVVVASTATMTGGTPVVVAITGINNPTVAGEIYARVITYDTSADATADATETGTGATDSGTVALAITDGMHVSGSVLESMVFCVSGATIASDCAGTTAPALQLGTKTGEVYVLGTSTPSTGDVYTQISTNAANGAVVSLKNSVNCGGMKRPEASTCDIPSLATGGSGTGFTAGSAGFGVIANADTSGDTTDGATGTYEVKAGSGYSGTVYGLNYNSDGTTGVTSAYGDPILDTNGTQPLNRNMKLTFGAQAANNTPAGTYSADMSLVATGTF